jgi:hypothetical protein
MTQQVHPAAIMAPRQSQQAWIISQHLLSPEVQVRTTPLSVVSHLHMPMVRLQQQTIMPFIITQQLHMPPASMLHRFCTMLQAILSSQTQETFMPPWHFSNLRVQRGTIIQLVPVGVAVGAPIGGAPMPGTPMAGIPIAVRSIIIALDILRPPFLVSSLPRPPGKPRLGRL